MVEVHAGDFKAGYAPLVKTFWKKRFKRIHLPRGWFRSARIRPEHISSVEIVTQENQTSILGKVGWGAAGALTLGGVGLLAGVLGGGNKTKVTAILHLVDGRSALISGKSGEIGLLTAACYRPTGG